MLHKCTRLVSVAVPAILPLLLCWACITQEYGRLKSAPDGAGAVTIDELKADWSRYHVYYAGANLQNPSAIFFNPKDAHQKIECRDWVNLRKEDKISTVITWLKANAMSGMDPALYIVLGPNKVSLGYMFTPFEDVPIQKLADGAYLIQDTPLRPFDYGPGGGN